MERWQVSIFSLALFVGCSGADDGSDEPLVCEDASTLDFDADSGWNSPEYCDAATDLGCFPFHESTPDTCGPFTTMRTTETSDAQASGCVDMLTRLNCGTYASEDGTSDLTFHIAEADRFTMTVSGTYQGRSVDTVFHFNPCDDGCMTAVTLKTIDPEQQKICEIPAQGKPACLFEDTAHTVRFVRADESSLVLSTAGVQTAMSRADDG